MKKVMVKLQYDDKKLEKLGYDLDAEIIGWLESSETDMYVEAINEIEEYIFLDTYNDSFAIELSQLTEYLNQDFEGISLEEFLDSYTWDESAYIREKIKNKVFNTQSYLVRFDMGNPVTIDICVEHHNQTLLTRAEIIEEALGYAQEVGIEIHEQDNYFIQTLQIKQ